VKTQAGLLMGSPAYMSPEQCRDSSDVDLRTDIYSLAIMVYEMLAGVPPFASKSATEMLVLQITADPPPLGKQVPDVPDYVDQTVMRALAKDREARFANVDYFVGALHGTYPALTAQGTASSTGTGVGGPARGSIYSPAGFNKQHTPAPASVGNFASRVGLTPGPMAVPSPTITTLSHATGEASTSPSTFESEFALESVKPKRWPLILLLGAAAAAGALFFVLRPARPAASGPSTMATTASATPSQAVPTVLMRIQSTPAGASVVDEKDGSVLGVTPFQKSYPRSSETAGVVLRLAGYKDKPVSAALDGNSTITAELERAEAVPTGPTAKSGAPRGVRNPGVARKAPKPKHNEEDEWRVH